jgi:uncharacterized protein (DUF2141 family)
MRLSEASASGSNESGALQELRMVVASLGDTSDFATDTPTGYAPVYYPNATMASGAQNVTLGVSEERSGVDIALQLVPMARVSGAISGAAGAAGSTQVVLTPTNTPVPVPGPRTTRLAADGHFSFGAVPPGSYTVTVFTPQGGFSAMAKMMADFGAGGAKPGPPPEFSQSWASADVVVDGRPLSPLALVLQPGVAVSGRVMFSGAAPQPDLTRLRVAVAAVGNGPERSAQPPSVTVDAGGHFTVTGVIPGRYRVTVASPAPWSIASAVVSGRDAMDFPFEVKPGEETGVVAVTMSDRSTAIGGTLVDGTGRPTSDFTVVAFAADSTFWTSDTRRIQTTRPSTDGRFGFRGLPPGDYRVAVVSDVEPGRWLDPAWLRQLVPSSVALTLADGQHATQDLRVH